MGKESSSPSCTGPPFPFWSYIVDCRWPFSFLFVICFLLHDVGRTVLCNERTTPHQPRRFIANCCWYANDCKENRSSFIDLSKTETAIRKHAFTWRTKHCYLQTDNQKTLELTYWALAQGDWIKRSEGTMRALGGQRQKTFVLEMEESGHDWILSQSEWISIITRSGWRHTVFTPHWNRWWATRRTKGTATIGAERHAWITPINSNTSDKDTHTHWGHHTHNCLFSTYLLFRVCVQTLDRETRSRKKKEKKHKTPHNGLLTAIIGALSAFTCQLDRINISIYYSFSFSLLLRLLLFLLPQRVLA